MKRASFHLWRRYIRCIKTAYRLQFFEKKYSFWTSVGIGIICLCGSIMAFHTYIALLQNNHKFMRNMKEKKQMNPSVQVSNHGKITHYLSIM